MLNLSYLALKNRLSQKVAPKYVDWFMGQYLEDEEQDGGALLWDTPAVFLEFAPVQWQTMSLGVQAANISMNVHLVTDNYHSDDQRVTDTTINLFGLENLVFKSLMNWRCNLSFVPGMEALADTSADRVLMESLVRVTSETDHNARRQMVSVQGFTTRIYDYSATKEWAQVLAMLELDVIKVDQL